MFETIVGETVVKSPCRTWEEQAEDRGKASRSAASRRCRRTSSSPIPARRFLRVSSSPLSYWVALLVSRYLSNAASFVFCGITCRTRLVESAEKACDVHVVLDKWFPLNLADGDSGWGYKRAGTRVARSAGQDSYGDLSTISPTTVQIPV